MGKRTGYIISKEDLLNWLDILGRDFTIFGPLPEKKNETIFGKIDKVQDIDFDYCTAMVSPRKFIYPSKQELFEIDRSKNKIRTVLQDEKNRIIAGIHPCDMHAITVLDRTFACDSKDFYYKRLRKNTVTIVLNCNKACQKIYPNFVFKGFCASMSTGPFLRIKEGFDIELTDLKEKKYLIESGSNKGKNLIRKAKNLKPVSQKEFTEKIKLENAASASFTKKLDVKGLPELLSRNLSHPVYKSIAEAKCLNCTNCTMVCPTCFCYNIEDHTLYDLNTTQRKRHWDSCYELNFAKVHNGNFRSSREARLRQFVTHKLCTWIEQYGCFGCVGCGRCMNWCPTNIDLTEIAKQIQQDHKAGKAR